MPDCKVFLFGKVPPKIPRPGLGMTNPRSADLDRSHLPIEATNVCFVIPSPGRGRLYRPGPPLRWLGLCEHQISQHRTIPADFLSTIQRAVRTRKNLRLR